MIDDPFSREWLETNGTGAFAAGSVSGACTRPYHNLFMVPRHPPVDRVILVHKCESFLETDDDRFPLSSNLYPDAVHPDGHRHVESFRHRPWPRWRYRFSGNGPVLDRTFFLVDGRSLAVLGWHLREADGPVRLSVHPMMSGREYQLLHHRNPLLRTATRREDGHLRWTPYDELPEVHAYHNGSFTLETIWYQDIEYRETHTHESTRHEDWWTPGRLQYRLTPGDRAFLLFSVEPDLAPATFEAWRDRERKRRSPVPEPAHGGNDPSTPENLSTALERAVTDFNVRRNDGRTLFAGYPWFTDWGRDTFISLPGFMLSTEAYGVARQILTTFGAHISKGMVPNRFPESGREPEYNTIDASLWYLHALGKYVACTGDESFAKGQGWTSLIDILAGYRHGTRYGIGMDNDGLIHGGTPNTQLTWMDAKVGDHAFTPRDGKPVEIQALWIRGLEVAVKIAEIREHDDRREEFQSLRERAIQSFRDRFWYDRGGYLYDVVDGHCGNDQRVRPNQIYAAMFEDVLPPEKRRSVVDRVESDLLTPVGLRTLAPDEDGFRGTYAGERYERDRAYHQGTVWPYLLGGFVSAWLRVREGTPEQKERARAFLDPLEEHLHNDACLGQVSEIFDGAPPHRPKGCIAQAWSVAEPLRALHEDVRGNS